VSGTDEIGKSGMKYLGDGDNVFFVREWRNTSLVTLKSFSKVFLSFPSVTRIIQVCVITPNKT